MEKCPSCGETLDALSRKVHELESLLDEATSTIQLSQPLEQSDSELFYVGSSSRQTFHRPNCKWASYITNSRNRLEFADHGEAVEAGYKPCKTCCA